MEAVLAHKKNMAAGWDVLASATSATGEKIARARVSVNGFSKFDRTFTPGLSQWRHELSQQGQYPGDNQSHLEITNDHGEITAADDSWSDN